MNMNTGFGFHTKARHVFTLNTSTIETIVMKRLLAIAIILCSAFANGAFADGPYRKVIVFGDSLSDTGITFRFSGIPPAGNDNFPYFAGRFSNGLNWIDYLEESLSLADDELVNFAVGGASTGFGWKQPPSGTTPLPPRVVVPTIGAQIRLYLRLDNPGTNELFILWAGANNIARGEAPQPAAANIESHIRSLATAGAKEFLIPNLPPLGETPSSNTSFLLRSLANSRTSQFNNELNRRLNRLENQLDVTIHRLDVFTLTQFALANPQVFGFTNTRNAALDDIADGFITRQQGESYIFWDSIHPTTKAHQAIAIEATKLLLDSDI